MLEYAHSDLDALASELASLCEKQSALMRFPAHKLRYAPFTRRKRTVLKKKPVFRLGLELNGELKGEDKSSLEPPRNEPLFELRERILSP